MARRTGWRRRDAGHEKNEAADVSLQNATRRVDAAPISEDRSYKSTELLFATAKAQPVHQELTYLWLVGPGGVTKNLLRITDSDTRDLKRGIVWEGRPAHWADYIPKGAKGSDYLWRKWIFDPRRNVFEEGEWLKVRK